MARRPFQPVDTRGGRRSTLDERIYRRPVGPVPKRQSTSDPNPPTQTANDPSPKRKP
jgi:hypothetical protein